MCNTVKRTKPSLLGVLSIIFALLAACIIISPLMAIGFGLVGVGFILGIYSLTVCGTKGNIVGWIGLVLNLLFALGAIGVLVLLM